MLILFTGLYGLFEDIRSESEKKGSLPSGILFSDKGGDSDSRRILILSDRKPHQCPQFGEIQCKPVSPSFLEADGYVFEVTINPGKRDKTTGKIVPLIGRENIRQWFVGRAPVSWGFSVPLHTLEIFRTGVQTFEKGGQTITNSSATLKGELRVLDRNRFVESFTKGIGRGRAFGFGFLQIVPLS
jgi:CRISPR system Cascade subunit CasE